MQKLIIPESYNKSKKLGEIRINIFMQWDHLEQVRMSYWQHLRFAWTTALGLLIHGLLPMVLSDFASRRLCSKHESQENH